ncbi:unnamed protein product [Owenia fusiformis]|uniref:Uncharacterized protein n=1 Tax=Owenia fusiformis TaxID=6347 RepID=A0A8J1TGE0_OWEFU|nr:unnamed protein product [Owenia fusiformis]
MVESTYGILCRVALTCLMLGAMCIGMTLDDVASVTKEGPKMMDEFRVKILTTMRSQMKETSPLDIDRPYLSVTRFLGSTPYVKQLSLPASQQFYYMKTIKEKYRLTPLELTTTLKTMKSPLKPNTNVLNGDDPMPKPKFGECPFPEKYRCDRTAKFRTMDGSCNNLQHPLWGKSFTPFRRLLPADYADGIDVPRRTKSGNALPSARRVSHAVHTDKDLPSAVHTIAMMTFGQFLDHDTDKTAQTKIVKDMKGEQLEDVKCGFDGCKIDSPATEACFPIVVPRGDRCMKKKCLEFVRSEGSTDASCKLGPREQINQITSYLDASFVYGSTKKESDELRDKTQPRRGRIKMTDHPFSSHLKKILPRFDNKLCKDTNTTVKCFKAGDTRNSEWVGLTTLHIVYAREHNRIEQRLHDINPHWDGERLYQESRRILGAIWQHQVYMEYLPLVLGSHTPRFNIKLNSKYSPYHYGYDSNVDASTANSFQAAAFRFGHSQVEALIRFVRDDAYKIYTDDILGSHSRRPGSIYAHGLDKGGVDKILKGQASLPAQTTDSHFTEQMSCHLFAHSAPFGEGTDLASLNIQRGRDHGIRGYNSWRKLCRLQPLTSWYSRPKELSQEIWTKFKSLYDTVDDIDLFPAGVSEKLVFGGSVGPTFACIIGRQFEALRAGDRYWHENPKSPGQFTQDQLREIKKSSIAKTICNNGDSIKYIQKRYLLLPRSEIPQSAKRNYYSNLEIENIYGQEQNERVLCSSLPQVDLNLWKETPKYVRKNNKVTILNDTPKRSLPVLRQVANKKKQLIASNSIKRQIWPLTSLYRRSAIKPYNAYSRIRQTSVYNPWTNPYYRYYY